MCRPATAAAVTRGRLARRGWNETFLNRFRHEKQEEENTVFVNTQPGAYKRQEKTMFVFWMLVLKVGRGGAAICPPLDLIILLEARAITHLQTAPPQGLALWDHGFQEGKAGWGGGHCPNH